MGACIDRWVGGLEDGWVGGLWVGYGWVEDGWVGGGRVGERVDGWVIGWVYVWVDGLCMGGCLTKCNKGKAINSSIVWAYGWRSSSRDRGPIGVHWAHASGRRQQRCDCRNNMQPRPPRTVRFRCSGSITCCGNCCRKEWLVTASSVHQRTPPVNVWIARVQACTVYLGWHMVLDMSTPL